MARLLRRFVSDFPAIPKKSAVEKHFRDAFSAKFVAWATKSGGREIAAAKAFPAIFGASRQNFDEVH